MRRASCSTSTAAAPALTTPADYMFNGGYVQVAYTLTGENRAYDKKSGCLSRYYFGTQGPYENAYLVRDEAGGLLLGPGRLGSCRSLLVYRSQLRHWGHCASRAASWMASASP